MLRLATSNDRAQVMTLLRNFYFFSPAQFVADISVGIRLFELHMQPNTLNLLYEQGDGVVGILMASIVPMDLGDELIAKETIWWVEPPYRTSKVVRMLDYYEDWARKNGATRVQMVELEGHPMRKLYERRGYRALETHYWKAL